MLVLRVLCDYADSKGNCWLSSKVLGKRTGIKTRATLSKAIKTLEAAERITVIRKHRTANFFRVRTGADAHPSSGTDHTPRAVGVQGMNTRRLRDDASS